MCWECNKNNCWCKEIVYWVCWLTNWWCIWIKEVTQIWECCKVYEISNLMTFSSLNNTLEIKKVWCNVDFSIKTSNIVDKLVSVNSADTPWYLKDKLKTCWNGNMSITPREISPSNRILEFCSSQILSNVVSTDERVAFKSWCTPDFLSWQLEWWACIDINKAWCKAIFSIKDCCFEKPSATITVVSDYYIDINPLWWVWLPATWITDTEYVIPVNKMSWTSIWSQMSIVNYNSTLWLTKWITVWKTWIYNIWYQWNNSISNWTSASLWNIYCSSKWTLLETWYIAPKDLSLTPYNPNDGYTDWKEYMEMRQLSWSKNVYLDAWDIIYIWGMIASDVLVWNWVWNKWYVWVLAWSDANLWTTLTINWISDSNGNSRNITC